MIDDKLSKVCLIGESCLDEYIYGTCDRVCPEAASLCFNDSGVSSQNPGMSGNVYRNILSLDKNIDIDHITQQSIIVKRRFIDKKYNTIVFRQDINDSCEKINLNKYEFIKYDYIIISDYCKGFLNYSDISYIVSKKHKDCVVFIDTKKKITESLTTGIDFIKINNKEFQENITNLDSVIKTSSLIVTQGDGGAMLYKKENKYPCLHFPTDSVILRDVCGAGDTFLAALVVKYIETKDIEKSIVFANSCACKVVSKFGVAIP